MAEVIAKLDALLQDEKTQLFNNQIQRRHALRLARSLCRQIESPMDHILRLAWQEPVYNAALKVCTDLKLFDILSASNDFMSVDEIAKATGADPALLRRILRHCASMGALRDKEPDSYALTNVAEALRRPDTLGGLDYWFDIAAPVCLSLPRFLSNTNYKDPTNMAECNWQMARDTNLNFFDFMENHPSEMASFANLMSGYASNRGSWLDLYPVQQLFENTSAEDVALVDVGGSLGHDVVRLRARLPQMPGRLIVQDLASVVAQAKVDSTVEMMAHDFFTEQPVKGKTLLV